jgi:hypothetical protein
METRWSLLQKTVKIYANENVKIRQRHTDIFSYYIAKSVCMVSVWDFIGWCITHNTAVLNFKNEDENVLRSAIS